MAKKKAEPLAQDLQVKVARDESHREPLIPEPKPTPAETIQQAYLCALEECRRYNDNRSEIEDFLELEPGSVEDIATMRAYQELREILVLPLAAALARALADTALFEVMGGLDG